MVQEDQIMSYLKILKIYFIWRISLLIVGFFAGFIFVNFVNRFPYRDKVLEVTNFPNWIWGFGNFDGVHYLRIAQNGYSAEYTQAFFPLFPLLINLVSNLLFFLQNTKLDRLFFVDPVYFVSGFLINLILFPVALYVLQKLFLLDYDKKDTFKALILILSFPTAFYFATIYTESLFLLLVALFFYLFRKQYYLLSGVVVILASLTKIYGVLLILCYLVEIYSYLKRKPFNEYNFKLIVGLIISPFGILGYMLYLKLKFDDALYFLSSQPHFGAGRSNQPFILLPQVLYRYLKIITTTPWNSLAFFNSFLEISFALLFIIVIIFTFKKIRFSYWLFILLCFLLPSLTGTFSSMPRYSLMLFLAFPYLVILLDKRFRYLVAIFIFLQVLLFGMFIRGYWIA